jgi:hypothetical protein
MFLLNFRAEIKCLKFNSLVYIGPAELNFTALFCPFKVCITDHRDH